MPRAIRLYRTGGPEVLQWEEVEVGEPGEGQARVRHTAIGVNFIDTYHRSGLYPLPLPTGLGSEGAGVVEAVGPRVTHVKPGWSCLGFLGFSLLRTNLGAPKVRRTEQKCAERSLD